MSGQRQHRVGDTLLGRVVVKHRDDVVALQSDAGLSAIDNEQAHARVVLDRVDRDRRGESVALFRGRNGRLEVRRCLCSVYLVEDQVRRAGGTNDLGSGRIRGVAPENPYFLAGGSQPNPNAIAIS